MKLSVAVITYNQEKYIRQCLEGIVNQKTDFEFEVVIGDDHSSDLTLSICEEYAATYPFIKILETPQNLGYAQNWKRTLFACQGLYIAPIEGDDYWTRTDKLQLQVQFLDKNPNCGLCYTDCDIIYETSGKRDKSILKQKLSKISSTNPFEGKGYICNVTWILRKTITANMEYPLDCLDIPLHLYYETFRLYQTGYVDINSGVYRRHQNSISYDLENKEKMYMHLRSIFVIESNYMKIFNVPKHKYHSLYATKLDLLECAIKYNDRYIIDQFIRVLQSFDVDDYRNLNSFYYGHIKQLQQTIDDIKSTKSYKLGMLLTAPLRWIKKQLNKSLF